MEKHLATMLKELENGQAQLLDVREPDEWEMGHLELSKLVPLSEIKAGKVGSDIDKNKKTYLHCRSGGRVRSAAPLLSQMGFKEVIPLGEGFDALVAEGFNEA